MFRVVVSCGRDRRVVGREGIDVWLAGLGGGNLGWLGGWGWGIWMS